MPPRPWILAETNLSAVRDTQFEVAVPIASNDDVPWPTARTPFDDELTVDSPQLRAVSGFGAPPDGLFATPFYALRVFQALRALTHKESSARKTLAEAEVARDELLAQLAQRARSKLQSSERFLSLYESADRHQESILALEQALKEANLEGSSELSFAQQRTDQLAAAEREQQRLVDDHRVRDDHAARELERARAQLRRLDIQERNLEQREERAPRSTDFDRHFSQLTQDREHLNDKLNGLIEAQRTTASELRRAEDQLRRAAAERKTAEGQKEGLLISLEGELYQHSVAYDAARHAHRGALADIGRAIVELRGQVQVDPATREKLLSADAAVYHAAHQLKATVMAKKAMDTDAYTKGKALFALALVGLLLLGVYLMW